jgi:TnpA family transposase
MLVEKAKALDRGHVEPFLSLLKERFPYARAFVPEFLSTLRFESARPDDELLKAIATLQTMGDEHRRRVPHDAPVGFIPPRLRGAVLRSGRIDRRAWELCLLSEVRTALRAGELTVAGSRRYTPWDAGLYGPDAWDKRRLSWYAEAGVATDAQAHLEEALEGLHVLTLEVAGRLPANGAARVERGKLVVDAPERLELAPEVESARRSLFRLMPLVDLPDLLMEVDRWCGFSRSLLHLTARNEPTPRFVAATRPALFAVLVAEATNLGLETMARAAGIPYGQLVRVHDWCFRDETLRVAVATLLDYHRSLPLTACFGPGTSSSSDGMRLGVSASVLQARHLSRAFGVRRGVSVYSHVSDQGSQFWVNVVNCLMREATFVLDGLLHQDSYRIREHYTDTHGYTDLVFGLFELLGFRFAPRLRDLPDQTLYRARRGVDYGALGPVLRRSIRPDLIAGHWDDMNRLAASLRDGLVTPSIIVAKLQNLRRQNPLQQAIQELGRLAKTCHLLAWVDNDQLRRRVLTGLNRQERLHSMARAIAFARGGRFPDRDYEAQLDRASALSVVINAVVVWNTRYLSAAGELLAARGQPVPEKLWPHVSPLHWDHVNLVGRYRFEDPTIVGDLRPLRLGDGNRGAEG